MQKIVTYNANEYMEVTGQGIQNRLNDMYDKIENISVTMSDSPEVQLLLTETDAEIYSHIGSVKNQIAQNRILDSNITDIALVSQTVYFSTVYNDEELDEVCSSIEDNMFQWLGLRTSSFVTLKNKQPMLVYGKNVVVEGEKIGTIIVSVNSSGVLDNQGNMPFNYALSDVPMTYFRLLNPSQQEADIRQKWSEIGGSTSLKKYGGYYIKSVALEKMNSYLVSVNSLDRKYMNINMIWLQVIIWSSIGLVILYVLSFFGYINNRIVTPLQVFYANIKEIREKKQRYMKKKMELSGCTEIQEIGAEFSGMMQDIDELNKEIFENTTYLYELKIKKQDAELSYLRGQVDPHFLYNTLEALRKQALQKGADDLAQMAVDMGNIFRYSSKGDDIVLLREELSMTQSYIHIQESRFSGRLKVFYMIPNELQDSYVIKMLLQPIVENAIYHGIEPKIGSSSIFIGVRREENALVFTVKDDGVGMETEKLEYLNEMLQEDSFDTSEHVGILNTHARLRLMYGKEYGLQIESSPNDGTSVFIRVPFLKQKGSLCTEY
ncbi:MAG: sensor histidine kinase [Lachnospiraceae bacterium]